jgi:hypothetical protein
MGWGLVVSVSFVHSIVKMKEREIIQLAVKVLVLILCVATISILGSVLGLPQASQPSSHTRRSSLTLSRLQNS